MALLMDEQKFQAFYRHTMMGYSKSFQRYVVNLMEKMGYITFSNQVTMGENSNILVYENKKDVSAVIADTTKRVELAGFYEYLEFVKLYKYSVPFFYELQSDAGSVESLLDSLGIASFSAKEFKPTLRIAADFDDAVPFYYVQDRSVLIKFVLQKSYWNFETMEIVDYRFPVVVFMDQERKILEIRYDATKYDPKSAANSYEVLVKACAEWLKERMKLKLFRCDHQNIIDIINDEQNECVKIYKQMMEMNSGGSAELTASESTDYVLPFVGELRELIEENKEIFDQSEEVKELLLRYLGDKAATASYPYIYIKWLKAVDSDSFTVKVTFDYFSGNSTVLQHITGECKDLGMERMNDAIKYLCDSGSFTKGAEINV